MSVATVAVADALEAPGRSDPPGPPLAASQTGGVPDEQPSPPTIPLPPTCDASPRQARDQATSGGALPARGALPLPALPDRPAWPLPALPSLPARLVTPALVNPAEPVAPDLSPVSDILGQLDAVQAEFDGLRSELNLLRRRDETLNFYLHRLDEELRLAARLQQDFLPRSLPQVGPVHFHTLFRPAGYVSGDLYDVARLDERRVGFYVADAVGHGMPAALLTMFIKQALVTKEILRPAGAGGPALAGQSPGVAPAYRLLDPGESLARLNATLVEQDLSQATFATALYGVIDAGTLEMRFAKAGHPSPLLLRAGGGHEWLDADGPLLGIFAGESFPARTLQLRPGDRVILYTDGIEMAFGDPQRPEEPRWQEELLRRRHLSSEQLLHEFSDQIDRESGSLDPRDDLTMMVIEVEG